MSHRKNLWQGSKWRTAVLLAYCLCLCAGCSVHKQSTAVTKAQQGIVDSSKQAALIAEAQQHWLYRAIPRDRTGLAWYDPRWVTWALLGNEDDGIFGEEVSAAYNTSRGIGIPRAGAWGLRNPLHNFCFYTIGSADKKNSEVTLLKLSGAGARAFHYEEVATTVFASEGTGFFLGLHRWKPFVSLRLVYGSRRFDAYLGWRERGNFGIKCIPCKRHTKKVYFSQEENTSSEGSPQKLSNEDLPSEGSDAQDL